jgi:hypothetical protein
MIDVKDATPDIVATIDVWDNTAQKLLSKKNVWRNEFTANMSYQNFELYFENVVPGNSLEFRTLWAKRAYINIDKVEIWPSLLTGKNMTVSVPWVYPGNTHNIVVKVDPDNNTVESNETNNAANKLLMPKLVLSANPQNLTADGISMSTITVTLVDENNNIVTSANNNITFYINGNGTWQDGSVGATMVALSNGSAMVRGKSTLTPGSFNVVASGSGLITSTVTIVTGAGQPIKILAVASPASIIANGTSVSTITASLVDLGNNVVVTATNTVTFSISGQGGTWLDGSVGAAFMMPAGGVASITVRSATQTGQITVNSSASGLTSAVTNINAIHGQPYKVFSEVE